MVNIALEETRSGATYEMLHNLNQNPTHSIGYQTEEAALPERTPLEKVAKPEEECADADDNEAVAYQGKHLHELCTPRGP